jgi:hypothetical protein
MAVTALWYGLAFTSTFNKEADWDTDTVKTMLTTSTYSAKQDTDRYKSVATLTANEVSSANYTAGGFTISALTPGYNTGTNVWNLTPAANASWTPVTFTARYAVSYDSTPGTDATRPLLSYVDFGADQTVSAATFTVQWAAGGIVQITVS